MATRGRTPAASATSPFNGYSSTGTANPFPFSPSSTSITNNFGRYFSRAQAWSLQHPDQYLYTDEPRYVGIYSPWFFIWGCIHGIVPFAYIYIGLVVLRELCRQFPETIHEPLKYYTPALAYCIGITMKNITWCVEIWCYIEAIFYICVKLQVKYLNALDPLETNLASAPILDHAQRQLHWERMMNCETANPTVFVSGWFFDEPIENISKYDIRDFLAWSLFEGRNQEHLTVDELRQLEGFVRDLEQRITNELYGHQHPEKRMLFHEESDDDNDDDTTQYVEANQCEEQIMESNNTKITEETKSRQQATKSSLTVQTVDDSDSSSIMSSSEDCGQSSGDDSEMTARCSMSSNQYHRRFRFREEIQHEEPNFFSDLFESYKDAFERMSAMAGTTNMMMPDLKNGMQEFKNMLPPTFKNNAELMASKFHPVEDLKNFMAEKAQQLEQVEETAMATATTMYETLVPTVMDKHLTAMSHATYSQLIEAWNSVKNMKERIETARVLARQRQRIRQQLKGYRAMLNQMREMSSAVPSKQMAAMMRRITDCNQRMEMLEGKARAAFVHATGFALKNIPGFSRQEPQRYAKFSADPLLGIKTYPLGFHFFVLGCTEIPLRILMKRRGFERLTIGSVNYYYYPGKDAEDDENSSNGEMKNPQCMPYQSSSNFDRIGESKDDEDDNQILPLVFIHGIGVGLLPYMPLIDALLESGRPIFLPEIPYVSGFRPWQSPNAVLQPAVVSSTMTAMLASHGFLRATWLGHSYGTSWLSYMVKLAPSTVAAIQFLDPICFGLHYPYLAKQFVYSRPDPGTASYIIRTDVIVNYTIQRSFPWMWIELFLENLGDIPCQVYLSELDALVPAFKVQEYFEDHNVSLSYFCSKRNKALSSRDDDGNGIAIANNVNGMIDRDESTKQNINDAILSINNNRTETKSTLSTSKLGGNVDCVIFRGDGHGDWTERPSVSVVIAKAALELCANVEESDKRKRLSKALR